MKKHPRRIISVLLALLMITSMFSSLGIVSSAENTSTASSTCSVDLEAKFNEETRIVSVLFTATFDGVHNAEMLMEFGIKSEDGEALACDMSENWETDNVEFYSSNDYNNGKYTLGAYSTADDNALPDPLALARYSFIVPDGVDNVDVDLVGYFFDSSSEQQQFSGSTQINLADVTVKKEDFEFDERSDGTLSLIAYDGDETEVTVPDSYDGKTVTGVDYSAFSGNDKIEKVVLPDTIKDFTDDNGSFNSGAFEYCTSLKEIVLSKSLTVIDSYTFKYCESLEKIDIPLGVKRIGQDAFKNCESLKEIVIPDSVTDIGSRVFCNCESLESVTLPAGITDIPNELFYSCSSLDNVVIPDSVIEIGYAVFSGCTSLKNVGLPKNLSIIGAYAFNNCTALESISIPEHTVTIERYIFSGCTALKDISIPDTVTDLRESLFTETAYYNNDENWTDGVLFIGNHLISAKPDVLAGEYSIPESTVSISECAFKDCEKLTGVTIPESISSLPSAVFSGCTSLENITFPESLAYIGSYAFSGCTALKKITVPDSVSKMGTAVFSDCSTLYEIVIPDSVRGVTAGTVANTAFVADEANWDGDVLYVGNHLITCKNRIIEGVYTVRDGTVSIGYGALADCDLLAGLVIPDSVTEIGLNAFADNELLEKLEVNGDVTVEKNMISGTKLLNDSSLWEDGILYVGNNLIDADSSVKDNIKIKDGTKRIEENAFYKNENITGVTIPDSVEYIGPQAFYMCKNLEDIKIGDNVKSVELSAFYGTKNYDDKSGWDNGCFYVGKYLLGSDLDSETETIDIKDGTLLIGDYAFDGVDNLKSVTIPSSVRAIGSDVFSDTLVYENEEYNSDGVVYIGDYLLYADPEKIIGAVSVKDGTKVIADGAFFDCISLTDVAIPSSVKYIGADSFVDTALKKVSLDDAVEFIGGSAFGYMDYVAKEVNMVPGFTVSGYKNSTAEAYANENGFRFITMCKHKETQLKSVKDATCVEDGYTGDTYCVDCGAKLFDGKSIPALGHKNEVVNGTAATCENPGLTDGVKCSVCGEMTTPQQTIPATGHSETEVKGSPATCENTGLTDGSKCSVCGKVLKAQETIPATGHKNVDVKGSAATCENTGLTDGVKCSVCGKFIKQQEKISALGHKSETVKGTSATCEKAGLTDGEKCSVCGKILKAQKEIPATGHKFEKGKCTVCGAFDPEFKLEATGDGDIIINNETRTVSNIPKKTSGMTVSEFKARFNGDIELDIADDALIYNGMKFKFNGEEYTVTVKGDVSPDGKITAADARLILRITAKLETADDIMKNGADLNSDGKITASEARATLRFAARLSGSLI